MPKDNAGHDAWVDEWGAEDDANAGRGTRSAEESPTPAAVTPLSSVADSAAPALTPEAGEPQSDEAQPELSWREMVRRTPLWVWLISTTALFGICAMFVTVMLIIALSK